MALASRGQAAPAAGRAARGRQHVTRPCSSSSSSSTRMRRRQLQLPQQQQQEQQQQQRRRRACAAAAAPSEQPPVLPEDVDLNDPEVQRQIDAMLRELDPDLLLEDTNELISAAEAAAQQQTGGLDQQPPQGPGAGQQQAAAWQEEEGDEETEGGLPDGVVLTRAEYKRKAAILLDLLAALQAADGEAGAEAFLQRLAGFRQDVDKAMLAMLARRLAVAQQHGEEGSNVTQLQELQAVLKLEVERAEATPAMRLLDEVLDMLGDDPTLPGGRQRTEAVISRLRSAFTGGASENLDVFAAAAALAEDKALAAEVLSVEFVPQPMFLAEGTQLLNQAREEMSALSEAVTSAQTELQQVRNMQPQLLEGPEAEQRIQQLAAADAVLQQRKAAVAQLALVLEMAQDLDAALAALQSPAAAQADAADELLRDPQRLVEMLGLGDLDGAGSDGEEAAGL